MIPGRRHLVGPALGLLADRHLAEPPLDPHPLEHYSALMRAAADLLHDDNRAAGLLHTAFGLAVGAAAGSLVHSSALATFLAADGHRVRSATRALVEPLAFGQVDIARERLAALGGPDTLTDRPAEIAVAAISSLAAHLTDAVIAPALGGVLAGAPGALACRALTALDGGSRPSGGLDEPFVLVGERAGRAVRFAPQRIAVVLVILARPSRAAAVRHAVRDQTEGSAPTSLAASAFGAALGVELDGASGRDGHDGGDDVRARAVGRPATTGDIAAAARLVEDAQLLLALALLLAGTTRTGARALRRLRRRGR